MQFNYSGTGFDKRKKPIPMPLAADELQYMADGYNGLDRMLFIQCYKFGQRISEALATKRGDVTFEQHHGKDVMVLNSITEKNRQMPFRVLPCFVDDPMSNEFADFVRDAPHGKLYPNYTRHIAYQNMRKRGAAKFAVMALVPHRSETAKNQWAIEQVEYCMHPHYLRHCCLTHKVLYSGLDLLQLMQFAGWSTPNPAMVYIHLNWRELLGGNK